MFYLYSQGEVLLLVLDQPPLYCSVAQRFIISQTVEVHQIIRAGISFSPSMFHSGIINPEAEHPNLQPSTRNRSVVSYLHNLRLYPWRLIKGQSSRTKTQLTHLNVIWPN